MSLAQPEKTKVVKQWKHESPLISCRFDPLGRFVFAGAQDFSIQRWELASEKKTALVGHDSWVRGLAFHPDGKTMISGGFDGRLIWWSTESEEPTPTRQLDAHDGWVRAVAVSPDGETIASCGNDLCVKIWSFADGRLLHELRGHERHVYNLAFHPDGQSLVSGDLMGVIKKWDLAAMKESGEFDGGVLHKYDGTFKAIIGGIRSMTFSPDGKQLACSGITDVTNAFAGIGNPLVLVFDYAATNLDEGKATQYRAKDQFRGVAWGVAFHPQGFLIAVSGGGGGGFLLFWNPGEKHEMFKFKLPDTGRDMHLHPDGLQVATAHHDGHLRISRMDHREEKSDDPNEEKSAELR